jgi:asparagine synthase (glutamine-hydrolysing)
MHPSQLLLVTQGSRALDTAEPTRLALARCFGVPVASYVLPEYGIVLQLAQRSAGAAAAHTSRRVELPPGVAPFDPDLRLVISAAPSVGAPEPQTKLLDGGAGVVVQALQRGAAALPHDDAGVLIAFDPARAEWTISRGAPGLRTLYYRVDRDSTCSFAAGTQLRALLPLLAGRASLDHVAVSRYLCNGFFCEPETPITGIRSLLPRERLCAVGPNGAWRPDAAIEPDRFEVAPGAAPSAEEARARVRGQLVQAIETRTARSSDTACLLSGGVDSSAVAAVAATLLGKKVHSYTLVFEDTEINESKYASAVAQRIGTDHHEVLLTQPDFEGSLEWMLGSLDMPTTDGLNSLLITRTIAQAGHPSALVGVGSDELFGGHECMQRVPRALGVLRAFNMLPATVRRGVRSTTAKLSGCDRDPWLPSHGLRGKFLALLDGESDPLAVYLLSRRVLLPEAVARLVPRADPQGYRSLPEGVLRRLPHDLGGQTLPRQVSYYEQLVYLRNQLLRDLQMVDVATGVGIAAPFVDRDLVSLVASLPPGLVFGGQRPKQFLIDCVSDILPREAYERPKLGFVLPIGHWLGGLVTSHVQRLSARADLLDHLGMDASVVQTLLADCAAARGRVFYTREWSLFILLDWCARNLFEPNGGH